MVATVSRCDTCVIYATRVWRLLCDVSLSRVSCSCACPKRWPSRVSQRGAHVNGTVGFDKETIAAVMTPSLKKGGLAEFVSDPRRRWPAKEGCARLRHMVCRKRSKAPRVFSTRTSSRPASCLLRAAQHLVKARGSPTPVPGRCRFCPLGWEGRPGRGGGSTSGAATGLESRGGLGVPARGVL